MSDEDDNEDYGAEHDNWDQWYAGSPLYPHLDWEWRGGDVQKVADRGGFEFCVSLMNDTDWRWGRVSVHGFVPSILSYSFSSWEIAAADCEAHNVN